MEDKDDKTEMYVPNRPAAVDPLGAGGTGRAPAGRLVCLDLSEVTDGSTSLEIPLLGAEVTVGRSAGNTVVVLSNQLSRHHVKIYPSQGRWIIEDLDSKNGTWVNDARVEQAAISPADTIRIGPIPFRFEIDRPAVEDGGGGETRDFTETIIDKTMLVGSDVRAASSLLRAAQRRENEDTGPTSTSPGARAEDSTDTDARRRRAAAAAASVAAQPVTRARPGSRLKPVLFGVAGAIVLAVGGYFLWDTVVHGEQRALAETHGVELKTFIRDFEQPMTGDRMVPLTTEALAVAKDLAVRVAASLKRYPDSPDLRVQYGELLFFVYERELDRLLQRSAMQEARTLLDQTRAEIGRLRGAGDLSKPIGETFDELGGLLDLSGAVIEIRDFKRNYPNPARDAKARPSGEELAKILGEMERFAVVKRQRNLALSVRYVYFLNLVREVDANDLRVVNRWREIL